MRKSKKVIVVMPAYNAEKTLDKTYYDIPKICVDEIILVDDGSRDETVEIAKRLGLRTIVHAKNLGYGANQKTCYREALNMGADIIVMLHPDYQYDPKLLPKLISPLQRNEADCTLGSRILAKDALKRKMPLYKYIGNRVLTLIENLVLEEKLSEYHTGYRSYSRALLETIPFETNSNNFVFDTEIIIQLLVKKFRIKEIPVPAKYFSEASSIDFIRSIQYGFQILFRLFYLFVWKITGIQLFRILKSQC